jgi:hypothetical protein
MTRKLLLAAAAVIVAAGVSGQSAWSEPTSGVKAGSLTCNADGGWGFVFGSSHDLDCTYTDNNGSLERYTGRIDKFGVDIGYRGGGIIAWAVLAPTTNVAKGAMAGTYSGVTGGAAVGVGGSANVLVGGSERTVSLQPVSVEGMTGLNVAAGLAQIVLKAVN